MTKKKGTPGGKIPRIACEEDEKRIIRFLKNQEGLEDLPTAKQQQLERKSKRFVYFKDGEGAWPIGEVLLYEFKSAKPNTLLEKRVYAGNYRFNYIFDIYHNQKNHQSVSRTYK